jgi:Uma2 family endonuclease
MTTNEYFRTPESVLPQELVFGAVRVADAPAPRHQAALRDIGVAMFLHVRERRLGQIWFAPIDVVLDRDRALVVQPDLIFVSSLRLDIVRDRVWGAPDLVVEVLSPDPRIGRLDERLQWFAAYGVGECWLLHQPSLRLEVLTFEQGALRNRRAFDQFEPIVSRVLPEFVQPLAWLLES